MSVIQVYNNKFDYFPKLNKIDKVEFDVAPPLTKLRQKTRVQDFEFLQFGKYFKSKTKNVKMTTTFTYVVDIGIKTFKSDSGIKGLV